MLQPGPIGVFDSGYGGLTVLSQLERALPDYEFCYLGDNARAPYGSRSFDVVYEFTKQAVLALFDMGCNLVVLGCNTASAKALRTIQQKDLPLINPEKRVLGVIRPTAEIVGQVTRSRHIAIFGTEGTIQSRSYVMEINKLYPDIAIVGEACPMWVPLIENNKSDCVGADYFVKENIHSVLTQDPEIDTIILGCTHYPLLVNKIRQFLPPHIQLISQGEYIATSLQDYLFRHPEIDNVCSKNGLVRYFTTESPDKFAQAATIFLNKKIEVNHITLK